MDWYIIEKSYIEYLQGFDAKVGNIEYGDRLKLYLGILMVVNHFFYYVPISSPKPKHYKMKNNIDFYKIEDRLSNQLYAVLNLNNMIPVPEKCIIQLKYNEIEKYRSFKTELEKNNYIQLLQKEKQIIDASIHPLLHRAQKLYNICTKNPNCSIALRCCNFKLLEEKSLLY